MIKRTRIKVCGITRVEDAQRAATHGVDAIGVILHAESPRCITLRDAMEIRQRLPIFVNLVGVFVNAPKSLVLKAHQKLALNYVQLHGDESPDYANDLGLPYIKAIRSKDSEFVNRQMGLHSGAKGILIDAWAPDQYGGTGRTVDPAVWPEGTLSQPLILAGGLNSSNVGGLIRQIQPFAVDLNSGVEDSPGIKSQAKLRAAIKAINGVGQN